MNPLDSHSLLPPPPRPHPIDRALSALDEAVALLVTSGSPSRFKQIRNLSTLAAKLAHLRPAQGVDDIDPEDEDEVDFDGIPRRGIRRPRVNDAVDLNREMLMIAQQMVKAYVDHAKPNPVAFETRINATMELADLMRLRVQLAKEEQAIPDEVNARIDQLLKHIGAPANALEPSVSVEDYLADPLDVRGHPPDGPGGPDGGGVGGADANGVAGPAGAGAEVQPAAER